jgi:hypothetical protein
MLDMYKEKPIHHDATLMLGVIVLGFFASFLGGFIVDIYRYLKHKYSKNISSHIGSKERI